MLMTVIEGLLWFVAICYCVSLAVVIGGNALGPIAARKRPMDARQQKAFARVQPSMPARGWGIVLEAAVQVWTVTVDVLLALRLWPRPGQLGPLELGTPVIICPGYLETAASMSFFGSWLETQGFAVQLVTFPSPFHSITRNAAFLRQRIADVMEATGADEVAVVGHSMGGLITRCMMLTHPDDHHVKVLVSFASPHRGLTFLVGAPGKGPQEMLIGSEYMEAFPVSARCGVPVHAIVALQDQIVIPPWEAIAEEGHNVVVDQPIGHMALMFTLQGRELTRDWLLEAGVETVR